MTKIEIIVLLITIFISVTLLCLFLDNLFKTKSVKKEKKEEVKSEKVAEEIKETVAEKTEEKELKKIEKVPEVSIALQDELNEFKDYLKTRITPEMVSKEEKFKHSYDIPKVNRYSDFDFDDFSDMDDFPFKKPLKKGSAYEDLPDDVKILLFTDFFDTKF